MHKIIYDVETQEITQIDLTEAEMEAARLEGIEKNKIDAERKAIREQNEIARKAILEKLGITEEEGKLLLS